MNGAFRSANLGLRHRVDRGPVPGTGNVRSFEAVLFELLEGIWGWRGMLETGEKAEILFAGRFHSPGGVDFGSQNLPDTLVVGLHFRVETRATTAMLGTGLGTALHL